VLLLLRLTEEPPVGAGPLSVTVPVELANPPLTVVGLSVNAESVGASTVRSAVTVPEALIVGEVFAVTGLVVTVKVAVVAPAATVALLGTCAALARVELSATANPPEGAGPLRVIVPVELVPPITVVGARVSDFTVGALIVRVADTIPEAVIVEEVFDATALVVTVKLAIVAPAPTVTLPGTCAALVWLDLSETTNPPGGAFPLRVIDPVELVPPVTVVGERLSDCTDAGTIVMEAFREEPFRVAVTVTAVELLTPLLLSVKVALLDPEVTATLLGTETEELLFCRATLIPLLGATPLRVTVPVAVLPPTMLCGLRLIPVNVGGFTVSMADAVVLDAAVIATVVTDETPKLVTVKFAVVAPDGTVTVEGTVATEALPVDSCTTTPAEPAAPLRVTVPIEVPPAITDAGDRLTD